MPVYLRSKSYPTGKLTYYLDIYHNGERKYEFLQIHVFNKDTKTHKKDTPEGKKQKKQLAEGIRATRELEIQNEEYGFVPAFKKNVDFIKYFQRYVEDYKGNGVRKFKYSLLKFKKFLGKDKLLFKNLNKKTCEDFWNYLKSDESGLSGETPYDYFKRFRTVINKAVDEGNLHKNPSYGVKVTRDYNQLKKEVLTKEELQLLANTYCGNEDVKKAFLFACFTGLGEAEIRKLTWERIQNNKIKLFREKNGNQIINQLHPFALKLIGKRGNPKEFIFILPSEAAIRKNLKLWLKRAKIDKKISFYCGRHTFAIQLLSSDAKPNLKIVADALGHSSTQHTTKYLNYVNELKDEAINSLPDIEM